MYATFWDSPTYCLWSFHPSQTVLKCNATKGKDHVAQLKIFFQTFLAIAHEVIYISLCDLAQQSLRVLMQFFYKKYTFACLNNFC